LYSFSILSVKITFCADLFVAVEGKGVELPQQQVFHTYTHKLSTWLLAVNVVRGGREFWHWETSYP
jgi:hypothetical protein